MTLVSSMLMQKRNISANVILLFLAAHPLGTFLWKDYLGSLQQYGVSKAHGQLDSRRIIHPFCHTGNKAGKNGSPRTSASRSKRKAQMLVSMGCIASRHSKPYPSMTEEDHTESGWALVVESSNYAACPP
jgi:hypothetical protein